MDPTRTTTLRRVATQKVRKKFALLKGRLLKLILQEDAFGLRERKHTISYNSLVTNPFVSEEQRRACHAKDDPDWDCKEWSRETRQANAEEETPTENCGGPGGTMGPCPTGEKKSLSQKAVGLLKSKYAKFSDRYGQKGAIAIMAAMAVTMPLPGNVLAVMGIAEGIRGVSKLLGNEGVEVANSFCPTGPGGGVDPSCSPGGFQDSVMKSPFGSGTVELTANPGPRKVAAMVKRAGEGGVRGLINDKGDVLVWDGGQALHDNVVKHLGIDDKTIGFHVESFSDGATHKVSFFQKGSVVDAKKLSGMRLFRDASPRSFGHKMLLTINSSEFPPLLVDEMMAKVEELASELGMDFNPREFRAELRKQLFRKSPVENVLCATGEGGGVDPSCSPSQVTKEERAAASFLHRWSWKGVKALPTIAAEKILKESCPKKPIRLYRFERVDHDPAKAQMGTAVPLQAWTRDESVARGVAEAKSELGEGQYRVVSRVFQPHEVYADMTNLPPRVQEHLDSIGGGSGMSEVLVRNTETPTTNKRWEFHSSPEKLAEFTKWLREQFKSTLLGKSDEELWRRFAEEGYRKGAGRAFDDVRSGDKGWLGGAGPKRTADSVRDFYAGTRDEFLRSSFGQPETVEKLQLLASRSFTDLKNVTEDMATRMGRTLMDGLARGANPRELVDDLVADLDVSEARAESIARTEIIRAHSEAQLDSMEKLGITEVGVAVEWSTAGDDRVCPLCAPMQGVVLTVQEAHGLIPHHTNCRCSWVPANVGEPEEAQKRSIPEIEAAMEEAEIEGVDLDPVRPKSVLNANLREFSRLVNAFCPTGPGGGVDPSCGHSFPREVDPKIHEQIKEKIRSGKPVEQKVSLDKLTATQTKIRPESIEFMVKSHTEDYVKDPITVVKIGKKSYIWDGTHRAEAARRRGEAVIEARVYS